MEVKWGKLQIRSGGAREGVKNMLHPTGKTRPPAKFSDHPEQTSLEDMPAPKEISVQNRESLKKRTAARSRGKHQTH